MVEIAVSDGRIVFAKWLIRCGIPKPEDPLFGKFSARLGRYRVEAGGIIAYTDEERADIEKGLSELGIPYTVEDISPSPELVGRASGLAGTVWTRSDALRALGL
jgi:hypothetical protein